MNSFIIICCVIAAAYGEEQSPVFQDGPCPEIDSIPFDSSKFSGTWYGCKENSLDILGRVNCSSLTLELDESDNYLVKYTGFSTDAGEKLSVTGTANIMNKKVAQAFYNHNSSLLMKNYYVLSTDYTRNAIVASCERVGSQHRIQLWSNKRNRKDCSNDDDKEKIVNAMKISGASGPMTQIVQANC